MSLVRRGPEVRDQPCDGQPGPTQGFPAGTGLRHPRGRKRPTGAVTTGLRVAAAPPRGTGIIDRRLRSRRAAEDHDARTCRPLVAWRAGRNATMSRDEILGSVHPGPLRSRLDMARAAMARAAMRRAAMPRCCRRRSADTAQHESQNENPALRPGANCPGRGHTVSAARRSAGPRDDVRKRPMTVHREDPLIGDFPLQDGEATPERISAYGIRTDPGDILPGAWRRPWRAAGPTTRETPGT